MHRQTPLTAAFVGYNSGGARALVDTADDNTGMQEMKGSMMFGEARNRVESPQNYGFTSVVLPAKKGKDGKIEESAEAYINYIGGNRSFPVAAVMDDRRHRPWGLKPGENAQYDDLGQMTLMRRAGLFMMSLDSADESQQSQSSGAEQQQGAQAQKVERMVSMRHVEKSKQPRPKGNGSTEGADHKHEGETVNTEVRCTKGRIEFRAGEKVVGFYDVAADTWHFLSKIIIHEATEQTWSKSPKNDHGMTEA